MKLIVGLGNPGKEYKLTRHNVGFMFIDEVVNGLNGKFTLDKTKKCEMYETYIGSEKVLFIKPQTYMNLSGESVLAVMNFYKIAVEDILVIYDDLDLEVGRIKIKPAGSSGGHRGVQSIIDRLKTSEVKRVRIGIAKTESKTVIDYVLGEFRKEEKIEIDLSIQKGYNIINDFVKTSFDAVMNKYNGINMKGL
jgi:PTH1 family peptidyl-tRNA hydrolase